MKRYIKTADGKLFDLDKIKKDLKNNISYTSFKNWKLNYTSDVRGSLQLSWTAVGTERNSLEDQRGKRCNFAIVFDCEDHRYIESDNLEELLDEGLLVNPYRFKRPRTLHELGIETFEDARVIYNSKDDILYGCVYTKDEMGNPILKSLFKMDRIGNWRKL